MTWNQILVKILDGNSQIKSPYNGNGILNSLFVMLNSENRMGYLLIWCNVSKKGVQISRIKIPTNVSYIDGNDLNEDSLPEIILQDVNFSEEESDNVLNDTFDKN